MPGFAARIALPLLLLHAVSLYAQDNVPVSVVPAAPAASAAKPATAAGVIDLLEGEVRVFDANRVRRTGIKLKDTVNEGDSVVTGADGELHVNMLDGGYLAVRPNTAMQIMQYRANGDANDVSVIGMVKGALRSVTGFIGQFNARSTKIISPTATIGIRGTDHETFVVEPNDPSGEPGTYDKVNAGGTFIETPQGRTEVSPNHAGFAPSAGNAKPRVLDHIPGFFKPTRNEHLIEGRHAQMQPKLKQLREQRRQQVQQAQRPKAAAAPGEAGKARETTAKPAAAEARQAERQQARAAQLQQPQARQQAIAEQQQKRQAARQQAVAEQQQKRRAARQQRIEAQNKAQQQKRKAPAEKEKEREK